MTVTVELLRKFSILSALADDDLEHLAGSSEIRKFNRRGIVLTAAKQEENLCFLFEGRLQGVDFTVDGREVGLYFIEPGDFCGELALFDKKPQSEHVIATTSVVTIFTPAKALRDVVRVNPEILYLLSAKLVSRLREMTHQRSLLSIPNIAQRVCYQLWTLITDSQKESASISEIQNPPTHMEIAIMLNVSRESVSRVFQALQSRQIVRRDGSIRLEICQLKTLRDLATGHAEM